MTEAEEEGKKNMWDQVDDFKWLKAEQSPNWAILPEGERVRDEVWREVVPGRPGAGTEDILGAVGVVKTQASRGTGSGGRFRGVCGTSLDQSGR